MAYQYETVKLDKGMYSEAGRSFTKVLEQCDPSEQYKGTPLEHLDAFQRQLKRFDIRVKGSESDVVAKFFATWESAILFPEYVARAVRQGMEETDILPQITAAETRVSGMDYRSIASTPGDEAKELKRVEEGAVIPETRVKAQENLVRLHKRGRMLVASYEAIQFQRLDLFSVTLRQIGAYINRMHAADAIDVLMNGDGNNNAAQVFTVGSGPISGTAGALSYDALVDFWSQFAPYALNTLVVGDALTVACAWGALAAMETAWEHGAGRVVSFSAGDLSVRETEGQTAEESANALRRQAERLMAPYARDEGFAFWEVEG